MEPHHVNRPKLDLTCGRECYLTNGMARLRGKTVGEGAGMTVRGAGVIEG